MHIHVIRTRYPHWGRYSGINQFLRYIDQSKYNLDMRIVSDSDEDFPIRNRVIRGWLRHLVQRRGMQWYKLSDLVAEIKALRQSWRKKVDIIHYLDGEHSAQFLPTVFKQLLKAKPKMIATYHQPPDVLDLLIIKDIIPMLDCITVVSPEQVSYFRELVMPDKIHLILHGIDTDYFKPNNSPKDKNKFRCITVGWWRRDFEAAREVANELSNYKDIEFHVITSKESGPELTGLEHLTNVRLWRDGIGDAKLLEQYQQADILFLPLLQSTANNALLEGIACGLPVVSTSLPSVKAYLSGKEAILIKDNDPQQFVEAILHLFHNPEARITMGKAARMRAEELDWRNIAPQYEAIYSKLRDNRFGFF